MWLDEGAKANFIRSFHEDEFYLTRPSADGKIGVYSLDYNDLRKGKQFQPEVGGQKGLFPFEIKVHEVFDNAEINQGGAVDGRLSYAPSDN